MTVNFPLLRWSDTDWKNWYDYLNCQILYTSYEKSIFSSPCFCVKIPQKLSIVFILTEDWACDSGAIWNLEVLNCAYCYYSSSSILNRSWIHIHVIVIVNGLLLLDWLRFIVLSNIHILDFINHGCTLLLQVQLPMFSMGHLSSFYHDRSRCSCRIRISLAILAEVD